MQHEDDKLTDVVCDLRQACTPKNYRQVHMQILAAVRIEREARFDGDPTAYVAAPICYWPPGSPPDEIDVFWSIYGPGPYAGPDGRTERRPVNTGMVVHHMPDPAAPGSIMSERPSVDVLPNNMCFMDGEDAIVFARMMSLSKELHLMDKPRRSVEEMKREGN
jgi:hypothetical protein